MWQHFLVTAWRNLLRRRHYAIFGTIAIAIGLSAATLTALHVRYQMSWDKWLPEAENTWRLENAYHFPGSVKTNAANVGRPAGPALQAYFPEVESMTRSNQFQSTVRIGEAIFDENMTLVDPGYLQFLGLTLRQGDLATAIDDVSSVVLSARNAERFFGADDPLGETLRINERDYRVTGVLDPLPENTHLDLEMITRYDEQALAGFFPRLAVLEQWNFPSTHTYVRFRAGTDVDAIKARMGDYTDASYVHLNPARQHMKPTVYVTMHLRRVTDIHLHSDNRDEMKPGGSIVAVFGLAAITLLILAAVIVNYVNLATALSTLRAREIGLRKILGARPSHIRWQFLGEAVMLSLVALVVSLLAMELALPWFNQRLELGQTSLHLFSDPALLAGLVGLAVIVGLLAGLYPAFELARVQPVRVLAANRSGERVTARARSVLIVFQFMVSVGLVIAIFVVYQQTRHVTDLDLGVRTDNTTIITLPNQEAIDESSALVAELRRLPGVEAATRSSNAPAGGLPLSASVEFPWMPVEDPLSAWFMAVGDGFFATYEVAPVAGRLLSSDRPADVMSREDETGEGYVANMLMNQTALTFMGIAEPAQAIGREFRMGGGNFQNQMLSARIVGVIPDFQFESAYEELRPTFYIYKEANMFLLSVRSAPGQLLAVQDRIREVWNRRLPGARLNMQTVDERIEAQYEAVIAQLQSLWLLAVTAMLVAGLGLLGMASFMVERHTREIAVRKVLGARVDQIVLRLLRQFSIPVLVANLLAWPLVAWLMHNWLQGFVNRIELGPLPFVAAGAASLAIAWLIVSAHAIRAASVQPARVLREA